MFAKEGKSIIVTVVVISILLVIGGIVWWGWGSILCYTIAGILTIFTLFFFRDPERNIPAGDDLLLAPADGKIILVQETDEMKYLKGKGQQISIFLSPLDVHVNRVPITGKIELAQYYPGRYLVAWHEKSSELNERSEFGIRHSSGTKVYFKQIAGFMARRIVYDLKVGDQRPAGYRFGMMKFGSRMDIIVPSNVEITVHVGQKAVAGETIMGKIKTR